MDSNLKFSADAFDGQDISSLSDTPNSDGMTAAQLKARFDNIGKVMIALGKHNDLVDALTAQTAAAGIGAVKGSTVTTVQELLSAQGDAANIAAESPDGEESTVQERLDLLSNAANITVDQISYQKVRNPIHASDVDYYRDGDVAGAIDWVADQTFGRMLDEVTFATEQEDGSWITNQWASPKEGMQGNYSTLNGRINARRTEIRALQADKADKAGWAASRAIVSDAAGNLEVSDTTAQQIGYLGNVTSDVQAQIADINASTVKAANAPITESTYIDKLTDANDAGAGSIYTIGNDITSEMIANLPAYGRVATLLTYSGKIDSGFAKIQLYVSNGSVFSAHVRSSNYAGTSWGSWREIVTNDFLNTFKSRNLAYAHNTAVSSSNYADQLADANSAAPNCIYTIGNDITSEMIANLPAYGRVATLLTFTGMQPNGYAKVQIYSANNASEWYIRTSNYAANTWYPWRKVAFADDLSAFGGIYTASGNPSTDGAISLGVSVKAGDTVRVYVSGSSARVNIYSGSGSFYIACNPRVPYVDFTAKYDGALKAYCPDLPDETQSFTVYTGLNYEIDSTPKSYHVGASREYKSLTQLLLDLNGDPREKYIYIDGGTYDIFQEYADAGVPVPPEPEEDPDFVPSMDYFPYCVFVPNNTHIIGMGNVVLSWMPSADQVGVNQSKCVSPLNVAGTMSIENVEIRCKNGRYCIHDDPLTNAEYNDARKTYTNVRCHKYANDTGLGFSQCIGFGYNPQMYYIFDSCRFENDITGASAFYGHSRSYVGGKAVNGNTSPTIDVSNCIMLSGSSSRCVMFGNVTNTDLHIRAKFSGCYLDGDVLVSDEGNRAEGNCRNAFDLTFLNCGNPSIDIKDASNVFAPEVY